MRDMYNQGGHPPEPCGPHPDWTEYPHPGHPPVSYYMTAYDIAVKYGYTGTEEEWIESHTGLDGLSSYQIFLKYNPESTLTEEQWEAAVNAAKTAAEAARDRAEAAKARAEALVPMDYTRLVRQGNALSRKIAAITNGLVNRIQRGGICQTYTRIDAGEHPKLDEMFDNEYFTDFGVTYAPSDSPVSVSVDGTEYKLPGMVITLRAGLGYGTQIFFPYDFISDNIVHGQATGMGWQIWFRRRKPNGNSFTLTEWECLNGIDPEKCEWVGSEVTE